MVYHGHRIGELYDLENHPGEFDNLWDDRDQRELKLERLKAHLDALAGTISAGPPRAVDY